MTCGIDGSCCRICPGMWLAGIVLAVMLAQSIVQRFSSTTPIQSSTTSQSSSPEVPSSESADTSATLEVLEQ